MAQTKREIIQGNPDVSHQQALVNLLKVDRKKTRTHVIPGGKTLTAQIGKKQHKQAFANWFRYMSRFVGVKFSLVDPVSTRGFREEMIEEWRGANGPKRWLQDGGKLWLANVFAQALSSTPPPIYIRADGKGLYAGYDLDGDFGPDANDWKPVMEFWPEVVEGTYN